MSKPKPTAPSGPMYEDPAEPKKCPYGDPTCPCQDGDVCHYVDDGDTKAMIPGSAAFWLEEDHR